MTNKIIIHGKVNVTFTTVKLILKIGPLFIFKLYVHQHDVC